MCIDKAKKILLENGYTVVAINEKVQHFSTLRGVKPLVSWYQKGVDLNGLLVADKVVGKGAAFLYLLLNATHLYAGVISQPALELLRDSGVKVEYGELVKNIVNRTGDGVCPFELAVSSIQDKFEAYKIILNKMKLMNVTI